VIKGSQKCHEVPLSEIHGASIMKKVVIIGAGPAGLTAAYQLFKHGTSCAVFEKDQMVGGISRTVNYRDYLFDIGGHRFFTKIKAVEDMWKEVLEGDMLRRDRLSRIFYNKKFFYYPLRPVNALLGLGIWNSTLILLSYLRAHILPYKNEDTFEEWVTNRFGKRLYSTFFKTYTEKVWGIPCREIRAEWAAQRIKGLSLVSAVRNALMAQRQGPGRKTVIKTLIDSFDYPKYGPGMMWQAVTDIVGKNGSQVHLGAEVEGVLWDSTRRRIDSVEVRRNGTTEIVTGTDFLSSMPIRELVQKLRPAVPDHILRAANNLKYRDFLTVALIVNNSSLFPDNWIYIHDPSVKVGRVQNFKNWSPLMVPDESKTCVGLEYFCFEGDEIWNMPDHELIDMGKREMNSLGLLKASDVEDGKVVRMPKAYPAYDSQYREMLATVREFLGGLGNLQLVGRNGLHRYNNQDHSMLTAMLAVENIYGGQHDLWNVNVEQEYHEEKREEVVVPEKVIPDAVILRAFARLDKFGFATAVGTVSGLLIFVATLWVALRGGEEARTYLELMAQFFPGYTVSPNGAFEGMFFGATSGFLFGWFFAYLRNALLALHLYWIKRKTEMLSFTDYLDQY
jgi:protoporphyrinogen oxidase